MKIFLILAQKIPGTFLSNYLKKEEEKSFFHQAANAAPILQQVT
jgi:hypothetical protein